ncbi:hypothetical protein [Streptococcus thermophilus]
MFAFKMIHYSVLSVFFLNFTLMENFATEPYTVQTVTGWVKKAQIIGTDVTGKPVTRAQFNAMQKEVARLKEENEILKIAAVLLGEHRK